MSKKLITIILASSLLFGTVGCTSSKNEGPISRTELFMGTAIKVTLYDSNREDILDKVFKKVIEIEDLVSINKDNTEIYNLNKNSGIKPVKLSDTSFNIIKKGLEYSEISKGEYDISIGPLVKLWSIGLPEAKVPTKKEIDEIIKYIGYSDIEINNSKKEVYLSKKGMQLDLGSIAKGYAADEIVKLLKNEGVKKAIIDLGGNIYALGKKIKIKTGQ